MTARSVITRFNRGEVSPLALARDDVRDITDTCELMENFLPIRLGPMRFRPGFEYIGDANDPTSDTGRSLSMIMRSTGDALLIETEQGGNVAYFWKDGIEETNSSSFPPAISVFSSGLPGWTVVGSTAYSSAFFGSMHVSNTGGAHKALTVTAGQRVGYLIQLNAGPCYVRVGDGAAYGLNDLVDVMAFEGSTLIEFTPTTTQVTLSFMGVGFDWGDGQPDAFIDGVIALGASSKKSAVVLPALSGMDFKNFSYATSADVMFIARGANYAPRMLKRIGSGMYSGEAYIPVNGPFKSLSSSTIKIQASAISGYISLTSTASLFDDSYVGRLIKLIYPDSSVGPQILSTTGTSTDSIAVMGYGFDRDTLITINETSGAVFRVELRRYSLVEGAAAYEVVKSYTTSTSEIRSDENDGELYFYYLYYAAGSVNITIELSNSSSNRYGVAYITSVASGTSANAMVYKALPYAATDTGYWQLGAWGPGEYPQSVSIYEGRIAWASKNRIDLTVVDDYYSFRSDEFSSSDGISRTIGTGPVDNISWMEATNGLFLGLPTSQVHVRSSNFEEPLTLTNTSLRPVRGSVGAKPIKALASDDMVYFVSRDGKKLHTLDYLIGMRPTVEDQMILHPDICVDGIAQIEVTKHPETRIWVLTETGELRVLLKEPSENIQSWCRLTVDGTVEAIGAIPAIGEDELWAIIRRNGNSRLYKLSQFSEIAPVDFCKRYTSPGTATLTGLSHLEGETVHVWADNQFLTNTYTVSSGQITIDSAAYTTVFVGKQITAKYKSNKLGQYVSDSVIGERKRVVNTALVMRDYSPGTLKVGRDFNHLRDLPNAVAGTLVTDYDEQKVSFGGTLDTDSRICLQATGPCTVMALAYSVNTSVNQSGGQN